MYVKKTVVRKEENSLQKCSNIAEYQIQGVRTAMIMKIIKTIKAPMKTIFYKTMWCLLVPYRSG
jgi:hypothetical protein